MQVIIISNKSPIWPALLISFDRLYNDHLYVSRYVCVCICENELEMDDSCVFIMLAHIVYFWLVINDQIATIMQVVAWRVSKPIAKLADINRSMHTNGQLQVHYYLSGI